MQSTSGTSTTPSRQPISREISPSGLRLCIVRWYSLSA